MGGCGGCATPLELGWPGSRAWCETCSWRSPDEGTARDRDGIARCAHESLRKVPHRRHRVLQLEEQRAPGRLDGWSDGPRSARRPKVRVAARADTQPGGRQALCRGAIPPLPGRRGLRVLRPAQRKADPPARPLSADAGREAPEGISPAVGGARSFDESARWNVRDLRRGSPRGAVAARGSRRREAPGAGPSAGGPEKHVHGGQGGAGVSLAGREDSAGAAVGAGAAARGRDGRPPPRRDGRRVAAVQAPAPRLSPPRGAGPARLPDVWRVGGAAPELAVLPIAAPRTARGWRRRAARAKSARDQGKIVILDGLPPADLCPVDLVVQLRPPRGSGATVSHPQYPTATRVVDVDAGQPAARVLPELQQAIWDSI